MIRPGINRSFSFHYRFIPLNFLKVHEDVHASLFKSSTKPSSRAQGVDGGGLVLISKSLYHTNTSIISYGNISCPDVPIHAIVDFNNFVLLRISSKIVKFGAMPAFPSGTLFVSFKVRLFLFKSQH